MKTWKFVLLAAGVVGTLVVGSAWQVRATENACQDAKQPAQNARYTIIGTEGTNLIVTDNNKSMVYYYTIDPDETPGADLKLRGQLDLTQVGQKVLKPELFLEGLKPKQEK